MATNGKDHDLDPWSEQLPVLLTLLDGLARRAVTDTHETGIGFLRHLHEIEARVIAGNRETDAFLDWLCNINDELKAYDQARVPLDQALQNASAFGQKLSEQIFASHSAMQSVSWRITQMRAELLALASDTPDGATLAQHLLPFVDDIRADLQSVGLTNAENDPIDVTSELTEQSRLFDKISATIENLIDDYASMIQLKLARVQASQKSGLELERAICLALASAQNGDIIRQQIELIADVILSLRHVAEDGAAQGEVAGHLAKILDSMPDRYVMQAQHNIHQLITKAPSQSEVEPSDDLPKFELF